MKQIVKFYGKSFQNSQKIKLGGFTVNNKIFNKNTLNL